MGQVLLDAAGQFFLKVRAQLDFAKTAVIVGIFLRLKSYLECRPLWVDECWSAIEIVNRSFWEILTHRYIFSVSSRPPTLFIFVEKISVLLFGNNEWALRLPPFLFSVASVVGFYYLAKKFLSPRAMLIAVWLFAVSEPLVFYAAEAKRYSTSIFSIIFLWIFAYRYLTAPCRFRWILVFGLLGAVFVWLSYASFFIVAAVFITLGIKCIVERNIKGVLGLVLACIPLLLSTGLIYHFVVSEMLYNSEMKGYFSPGLWKGQVFCVDQMKWLGKVFLHSFQDPAGFSFPFLMMVLAIFGFGRLFAENRLRFSILALISGLALLAAASGYYPFHGRVILFLTPVYFFVIAGGIDFVSRRYFKNNQWILVILLMLVFGKPLIDSGRFLFENRTKTENRELLTFFSDNYKPGDAVYLNQGARYPYYYYALSLGYGQKVKKIKHHMPDGRQEDLFVMGVFIDSPVSFGQQKLSPFVYEYLQFDQRGMLQRTLHPAQELIRVMSLKNEGLFIKPGRNWLLISLDDEGMFDEAQRRLESIFEQRGRVILKYEAKGVAGYLYEI